MAKKTGTGSVNPKRRAEKKATSTHRMLGKKSSKVQLSVPIQDLVNEYGLYHYPVNRSNFFTPLDEAIMDLKIHVPIGRSFLSEEGIVNAEKVEHFTQLYGLMIPVTFLEADGPTGHCEYIHQILVSYRGMQFLHDFFRYKGICK